MAICVDLAAQEVPWWDEPPGATSWLRVTRLDRQPVGIWWRSSRVPVWNHRIVRPLLVWDVETGLNEEHLSAIGEGRAADLGLPEPPAHALADPLWRVADGYVDIVDAQTSLSTAPEVDDIGLNPTRTFPKARAWTRPVTDYLA